jgi:chromosome segregation ATPase
MARLDVDPMNPAPAETAEILHRVRQQLLLAQVRIMELEDSRDEKAAVLSNVEKQLEFAQAMADQQLEEAAHLEKVRSDLQVQYEHMRHMQHVTNEALTATREQLASTKEELNRSQNEALDLKEHALALNDSIACLKAELNESKTTVSLQSDQINQLSHELAFIKNTRSWRWTAWLRGISNLLGRRKV